jgi:hypothetical protein
MGAEFRAAHTARYEPDFQNGMNADFQKLLAAAAVALALSGCAVGRSTIDLMVAPGEQAGAEKAYVKIQVADQRVFQLNPTDPSVPSLSEEDFNDFALRARAIARKRNAFGQALGDVALPEGRTVAQLVREAATKALRQQGYAVVEDKSPMAAKAMPLDLGIVKFWSWGKPGFAAYTLTFESEVAMRGDMLAGGSATTVQARTEDGFQIVTDGVQQQFTQGGVNQLVERMKAAIRVP